MKNTLLWFSLGTNVLLIIGYQTRIRRFDSLVEKHMQLGYRVNSLLSENGMVPDPVVVKMLQDLGIS